MKPTSFFLACSLAFNAALTCIFLIRPAPVPPEPGSFGRTADAAGGLSAGTRHLLDQPGNENLDGLRDRLLAEGLPARVVRQIIEARLWAAHQARVEAADPIKKRPWWQQTETQLPGDDLKLERIREISFGEFRMQMSRLFPDEGAARTVAATAFLPPFKQTAIQKLTDDYEELRAGLRVESGSPYEFEDDRKKVAYLQDSEKEDLQDLLSESEYREFKLRDVGSESFLKKKAAWLNMSEAEFRGMRAINEWRTEQSQKFPPLRDDPFAALSPEQAQEQELLNSEKSRRERELLGAERYALYLRTEDPEYENLSRYVARYELPASRITEYFKLSDSAYEQARALIAQDAPLEQRQRAVRALAETVKASLQELMGPQSTEGLQLGNLIRRMETSDW